MSVLASRPQAVARALPSVPDPVLLHNRRPIGVNGWRRVLIEMRSRDVVTRRFQVVNVWREAGRSVDTAFFLEWPERLRGTAYVQSETPGDSRVSIDLFIPAGARRVRSIDAAADQEGLLGSDFSYQDLCWRLPLRERRYDLAGTTTMAGEPAWVVSVVRDEGTTPSSGWRRGTLYIGRTSHLLLGADYLPPDRPGVSVPAKTLRVLETARRDGVWMPVHMTMRTGERSTQMHLLDARIDLGDDLRWVGAQQLPQLERHLLAAGLTSPTAAFPP